MPAPAPPTAEQWEFHRAEICRMYKHRPLKAIRTYMQEHHGFHATDRMYKTRFSAWRIMKNRRHINRTRQVQHDAHQPSPPTSPPPKEPPLPPLLTANSASSAPACSVRAITWRGGSAHPESDSRSTTTAYTATPGMVPANPATTTLAENGPTMAEAAAAAAAEAAEEQEEGLDADTIGEQIVELAISMLEKLPLKKRPIQQQQQQQSPATATAAAAAEPNGDHVEIFQTLQTKLRHEGRLRGCLVNSLSDSSIHPSAPPRSLITDIVKDMLSPLYPAAPIGVLSIFNQLRDWQVIHELADCLIECARSLLAPDDAFTRFALAVRRLLRTHVTTTTTTTTLDNFLASMAAICDTLERRLQSVLGQQSLVRVYLVFLLNANKAKSKPPQVDDRVLSMALKRFAHVQHAYGSDAKLILEINLFIVGYLSLVAPGEPDVAIMANDCYTRATDYLAAMERAGSEAEIKNAKLHLGKSCAYLADCLYAVGREVRDDEQCSLARGMLLVAIGHHADCAEATYAHVGRQMEKLSRWCAEAKDTARLDSLNLLYEMIEGKERRPKGEALLPRLGN